MTLTLNCCIVHDEEYRFIALQVEPDQYLSQVRTALYERHKRYFIDINCNEESNLLLYTPKNLELHPPQDRLGRVKSTILGLTPDDSCLVRDILTQNCANAALIHLVVVPVVGSHEWLFSRADWELETDAKWQKFFDYWGGKDFNEVFRQRVITLVYDDCDSNGASHRMECLPETQDQFLVLESYRIIFTRVWEFQKRFPVSGVVLTGQPGTGKSTWLWFMLICLITKHEPVAFYFAKRIRLFYRNCVYQTEKVSPDLPSSYTQENVWCLVDSDDTPDPPPTFLVSKYGSKFPVQASPPNPEQYDAWFTRRFGVRIGMPLWGEEDLLEGFKLCRGYMRLLDQLVKAYEGSLDKDVLATDTDLGNGAISAWQITQEGTFTGDSHERAERALKKLLRRLIYEYGDAAGDVYNAFFHPQSVRQRVKEALEEVTVDEFVNALRCVGTTNPSLDRKSLSHRLIAITVDGHCWNDNDGFVVKFRSEFIGKQVIKRLGNLQPEQAQKLLYVYRSLPQSSLLAGWIFRGLAHGVLSNVIIPLGPLIRISLRNDTTTTQRYGFLDATHARSSIRLPRRMRISTVVEFSGGNVVFPPRSGHRIALEDYFCVSKNPNNPLFDSFFVEFEKTRDSVTPIIWIFQATISSDDKDYEEGHSSIRSIKAVAENRAKELAASQGEKSHVAISSRRQKRTKRQTKVIIKAKAAELKYVLVCPSSEQQPRSWRLPEGWTNPVQGEVFCQFIETSESHLPPPYDD